MFATRRYNLDWFFHAEGRTSLLEETLKEEKTNPSLTKTKLMVAGIGVSFRISISLVTVQRRVTRPKLSFGGVKHTAGPCPLQIT